MTLKFTDDMDDYRKVYDSVPHSWIVEILATYKVATNIQHFLKIGMLSWRTTPTLNGYALGQMEIKREVFQGDALSPLIFVMCLFPF